MTNEPVPTYEQLKRRLDNAEGALQALRAGQVDTIASEQGNLVVRLAEAEAQSRHIKQVLLAIRNVNQLIVTEDDPLRLIEKACANLTESMGYLNAWIALLDPGARTASLTASSGFDGGFVLLNKRLKEGDFTRCMKRSLESDEIIVVKDPRTECLDCPLSSEYGGRAGLSRSLSHGGKIYGILAVSVPPDYASNEEEQVLFGELANDLAFALHKIEAEKLSRHRQLMLARTESIAHIGSWEWEIADDRVSWSEELFRIFQRDPELGAPCFAEHSDLYVPEDMQRLQQAVEQCVAEGTPYRLELRAKRKDGEIRHCVARGLAEVDSDVKACRLFGSLQDITERKLSELVIATQQRELELTLNATTDGIWFWNFMNNELRFSSGYYAMLGYEANEFPADFENWKSRIHPDDLDKALWVATEYLKTKPDVYHNEFRMRTKQGVYRWISAHAKVVERNDQGEALRMIGSHQDITDRKQAENEREKLEAQLRQSQKMESVGRLAGGVAHDFNNMLGVILGHVELALDYVSTREPIYEDLTEIFNAARRSADITRQLLAFARKQTIAPVVIDLNETIEGMLKMLRRLIGEDIDLAWLPETALWPVKMDPSQIDQILANLCVNARDAIDGVGKLTIETGKATFDEADCMTHAEYVPGDFVLLAVSDNGCGMDSQTLDNLFEPFYTTKGLGKGTGLGLATVYGIVKQNQGFINVYSELGEGTTFRIYIPAYKGSSTQALSEKVLAIPRARDNETILLVEDEPTILKMTKMMLERFGYNVLPSSTPEQAIKMAREYGGEIHLLMTDVVMPGMNGKDLAEKLMSVYPNIKRLFMSGYTANVIAHHGILDEGVQFIQKPFSKKNLAIKIRHALDQDRFEGLP